MCKRKFFLFTIAAVLSAWSFIRGGDESLYAAGGTAAKVFVSPGGDDSNAGTEEKPLRSLAAAQKAAQKLSANHPVTVVLCGGTYYLNEPLVLGPQDSGITYAARPGEIPVLSGGLRLQAAWKPFRDGILSCSVEPTLQFTQL